VTAQRILQLNAIATAACGFGMLAARTMTHSIFAIADPILLDLIAIGLLAYAAALGWSSSRRPVSRHALLAFTVADGLWVLASAIVLVALWTELLVVARVLMIAVALAVDTFAVLQFRAARETVS
jgi:hypothetical protein